MSIAEFYVDNGIDPSDPHHMDKFLERAAPRPPSPPSHRSHGSRNRHREKTHEKKSRKHADRHRDRRRRKRRSRSRSRSRSRDRDRSHKGKKVFGTCKRFYSDKGYGFIQCEDGSDVFVHQTDIYARGFRSLQEGEALEFEIVTQNDGRTRAINVTGPRGAAVQGKARGSYNQPF
eukprot:82875_1